MPIIPFAATIGAALGATGTAAAWVGGTAAVLTASTIGTTISGQISAAQQAAAAKKAANAGNASQVDAGGISNVNNLGRAALISTSPQGVQGTDPSLRYKLLGNASGLGN